MKGNFYIFQFISSGKRVGNIMLEIGVGVVYNEAPKNKFGIETIS
jgi:hypothetical protein